MQFQACDIATIDNGLLPSPLHIDLHNPYGSHNRNMIIHQYAGQHLTNIPGTLDGVETILYRRVYWRASENIMVEMTEMYPLPGRTWCNFYNIDTWSGWTHITPQSN